VREKVTVTEMDGEFVIVRKARYRDRTTHTAVRRVRSQTEVAAAIEETQAEIERHKPAPR
jgi:hypothetical protein